MYNYFRNIKYVSSCIMYYFKGSNMDRHTVTAYLVGIKATFSLSGGYEKIWTSFSLWKIKQQSLESLCLHELETSRSE